MLVVLGFYKRKQGMSHTEFSRYWREVHGPLIRDQPDLARHITYYVQHHLTPNPSPAVALLEFDGFSEVWFESEDDRKRLRSEPAFLSEVMPDEDAFLDISQTRISMYDSQQVMIDRRTASKTL